MDTNPRLDFFNELLDSPPVFVDRSKFLVPPPAARRGAGAVRF